ncbi:MAG: CBU_0592 family membrane protein [Bacteroidota bacterium]
MHLTIGWIGAFLYILAYFLLSIKKLRAEGVTYQVMNILGGVCLIVNSSHQEDYPSLFTNLVWAAIGVFAIYYNRIKK